jgi:glycosyltransferase involved in cell wall biosynthesis
MRVAFVLHLAKRDGAGNAAVELLASLRGRDVEAFVLLPSTGPLEVELRPHVAAVKVIPYRWWLDRDTPWWKKILRTTGNLMTVLPLCRAIRRWGCQIVYTNTLTVSVGAMAARLLGLPHVWHVHEMWGGVTGLEFDLGARFSLRLVNHLTDVCIANSQTVADRLVGAVRREKLHVVYQSVTLHEPTEGSEVPVAKLDPAATACLIVASILPLKRQEDAIRATALLKRQGLKTELWLAGEAAGPYAHRLRRLAESEHMEAEVRFLGFCENVLRLQQTADIVLSCSPVEAFGRATVEAMLAGKPVVAASGGGNSEIVEDGFNGLLYWAGSPDELARHIALLAQDPNERVRLGENARIRARSRFLNTDYGAAILAILESAVSTKGVARHPG